MPVQGRDVFELPRTDGALDHIPVRFALLT